jgi:hypothetical protein
MELEVQPAQGIAWVQPHIRRKRQGLSDWLDWRTCFIISVAQLDAFILFLTFTSCSKMIHASTFLPKRPIETPVSESRAFVRSKYRFSSGISHQPLHHTDASISNGKIEKHKLEVSDTPEPLPFEPRVPSIIDLTSDLRLDSSTRPNHKYPLLPSPEYGLGVILSQCSC